jgi:nucleoid DNA-binding protein
MNKTELVQTLSRKTCIPQRQINEILNALLELIIDEVSEGRSVKLLNFGKFERRDRRGRVGRNPKTGDRVVIPDQTVVVFVPGREFKSRVKFPL